MAVSVLLWYTQYECFRTVLLELVYCVLDWVLDNCEHAIRIC
jgi:hypothetical protein